MRSRLAKTTSFLLTVLALACSAELPEPPDVHEDRSFFEYGEGKADSAYGIVHPPLPEGATLDGQLQVLFAPHDPLMNAELMLIEEVIDARRSDSRTFSRESNPYRIHYAVYNLRSPDVINALVRARRAKVEVRIIVDSAQIDPVTKPWNTAYKYLENQGFIVEPDNKVVDERDLAFTDVLGVNLEGNMHLKLRVFETPTSRRVLTGSANPGDNVAASDDAIHVINDPRLTTSYAEVWDSLFYDLRNVNRWSASNPVNVLFTAAAGEEPATRILRWLDEEEEQILIKVFSLRDFSSPDVSESLVEMLAKKVLQGVPVYVITDRKQSDGVDTRGRQVSRDDPTEDRLRAAGVRVYESLNTVTNFTAMHHKAAVLGRTRLRVISGSANWSLSGLGSSRQPPRNVEDVLFIDSSAFDDGYIGRRYLGNWLTVLDRYAYQSVTIDGEDTSAEVFDLLSSLPGWPEQEGYFEVRAETEPSEVVCVEGDHAALGGWGRLHEGLCLSAGYGAQNATWSSSALSLATGSTFEWRLKAINVETASFRVEEVEPRMSRAIASPFGGGVTEFVAIWGEPGP